MARTRTKDINGRRYAKLSELKAGDIVEVDGGFTCMRERSLHKVYSDPKEGCLYVRCKEGHHDLTGQLEGRNSLIGIYPANK